MTSAEKAEDIGPLLQELAALIAVVRQEISGEELPESLVATQLEEIVSRLAPEEVASFTFEKRIGEGKFLAIGALGGTSLSILAGLLIHPGTFGLAIWKLRRLLYWDKYWRPHVIGLYVQLDGVDAQVFEAIHFLESQWVIRNFEAYEAGRLESAFGKEAPMPERIVEATGIDTTDVLAVLTRLQAARVVRSDGVRYWIPL